MRFGPLSLTADNAESRRSLTGGKMSVLEKLEKTVYLSYVLKVLGVAGFVVTYLNAWGSLSFLHKLGFGLSAAAFFVGLRFASIYRKDVVVVPKKD